MDISSTKEIVENLISDVALDLNYIIYESSILIKGERSKINVKIDRLQGISHQDCADFCKELSKRLDEVNVLPNYSLEMSSPGLTRKIRNIEEFKRFKGSLVKVIFVENDQKKVFIGNINNIIDTKIELKSDKDEITLDINNIQKANLKY